MKLGHFLTAMFVVYLLSILFGCWLNLKESQEMIEHKRYLEYIEHADSIVLAGKEKKP